MSKPRIAILGGSGFVGAALVERLFFDPRYRDRFEFTAFIHGHGGAARLARLPVNIQTTDLMDYDRLAGSLASHDYVVNCTRGDALLMLDGLKNLARVLKKLGTRKFVHLSSVSIYGEEPAPESATEAARLGPARTAYGEMKARQDDIVFGLHRSGVPSIILCPSNIGGPYSGLIVDAVKRLLADEIVLVDGGENPTNIVHVDNLVQGILAALDSDSGWGERYFVNETEPVTWRRFFADLAAMLGADREFSMVPREDVLPYLETRNQRKAPGPAGQLRILVSRDFRDRIKVVPLFEKMDQAMMATFNRLSPRLRERLRGRLRRPMVIEEEADSVPLDHKLITAQVRRVYHSPEKIMNRLGYRPLLTYDEGMETTRRWLAFAGLIPSPDSIPSSRRSD